LDNPEARSISSASTVSGEPSNNDESSNIDESSNVDNHDEQSNGESNQSTGSTKEFILTLDDPEVANYNKIQFLKARYINLQTQSKHLINLFSLILLCLTGFARFQIGFPHARDGNLAVGPSLFVVIRSNPSAAPIIFY
jgi:hypothetical protein